jgi:dipeptidyl aminopeptidase/acylaminoacyl peptidase
LLFWCQGKKQDLTLVALKDRSVPVKQSIAMYKALKSEDKAVEYIELEDGDHYLSTNSHRLETFKAMDRFLKAHLKP